MGKDTHITLGSMGIVTEVCRDSLEEHPRVVAA